MNIRCVRAGPVSTNSYLVWDDAGAAVLIDAGGGKAEILQYIAEFQLTLHWLINTHGHYDHIAENHVILVATGAKLLIHEADAAWLSDIKLNLAGFFAARYTPHEAQQLLTDGEIIECGQLSFRVIHTPGHTPGSICLLVGDLLFSGDTLFQSSIGRCDLIGGDAAQLQRSIKEKLLPLPDSTRVYPGHGPMTSIAEERQHNPFLG
jgi:glyoxylase-like metal-dependent hydrolase (beta-lactamase superfamily II)